MGHLLKIYLIKLFNSPWLLSLLTLHVISLITGSCISLASPSGRPLTVFHRWRKTARGSLAKRKISSKNTFKRYVIRNFKWHTCRSTIFSGKTVQSKQINNIFQFQEKVFVMSSHLLIANSSKECQVIYLNWNKLFTFIAIMHIISQFFSKSFWRLSTIKG